jgi:hypothetical protein
MYINNTLLFDLENKAGALNIILFGNFSIFYLDFFVSRLPVISEIFNFEIDLKTLGHTNLFYEFNI